jgi:HEPN superfamily AbiU2-like protein
MNLPKKKPTIEQVLNTLERQILFGKTYLAISRGLFNAEKGVYGAARTFFGLTADGGVELAAMTIARLYDHSKGSITLPRMLLQAENQRASFRHSSRVGKAIDEAKSKVSRLAPVLATIKSYRDGWFAHLDPDVVADPQALNDAAKVTLLDLNKRIRRNRSDHQTIYAPIGWPHRTIRVCWT